jgi:RHS repeat-associated protein
MQMPGRKYQSGSGSYRYGFNGKEIDNDVVQYDYGFRIYDPRLARFKSVDPLKGKFPFYTPYQFAGNSPIRFIDLDGLEVANPSIFRSAWNAITGSYHLNRMNAYLTKNNLTSDNVIELNNETSVVFQIIKNEATGTNQTIYSIFRAARQDRTCLLCVQSYKDDDIGLTESEFLTSQVMSANIMDAPIGLGSSVGAVVNGSKGVAYSFRQTVGGIKQGLRALENWKNEIKIGVSDALGVSGDLIKKGFHLHFNNLKGLELGLMVTDEGKLGLRMLYGESTLVKDGVKLFSRAMENPAFRIELIAKLKMSEEALTSATKLLKAGSREANMAANSLTEVQNVLKLVTNYAKK